MKIEEQSKSNTESMKSVQWTQELTARLLLLRKTTALLVLFECFCNTSRLLLTITDSSVELRPNTNADILDRCTLHNKRYMYVGMR